MKKERVLLKDGLISESSDKSGLLASKCSSCGKVYFPQRTFCLECCCSKLETVVISNTGVLYTYTIVNMPSAHYSPPYAIGWVEFSEGVRVFGQIDINEDIQLHIGMKMNVIVGPLWEEEDREIIAYKFLPTAIQGSLSGKEKK